jgi:hypothetical protein
MPEDGTVQCALVIRIHGVSFIYSFTVPSILLTSGSKYNFYGEYNDNHSIGSI